MTADFTGWSKLVLLTADRALLFPRNHEMVAALRAELEALRVVEAAGIPEIPRVLEVWEDPALSPYPIAATTRRPGTALEAVLPGLDLTPLGRIAEQLGSLAARWHTLAPGPLSLRPARGLSHRTRLADLLGTSPDPPEPGDLLRELAPLLQLDRAGLHRAERALRRARALPPVLVHSDLHEGQILVDPDDFSVTGVIDWQTAGVDHPFSEFDLGEWGPTIWRDHRVGFPELRQRYWTAYATARDLDARLAADFEWVWSASHAARLAEKPPDASSAEVLGTVDEALASVSEATRMLAP
ncbi:MAG: aminoglycoside phosphotransferase family protein [Myxococcales bacterium]|nr:aminoglycoside phosphotransferase family protein [Myxococcales bacterium]